MDNNKIICKLCGFSAENLTPHLIHKHKNITPDQYKKKYNLDILINQRLKDLHCKHSTENNPSTGKSVSLETRERISKAKTGKIIIKGRGKNGKWIRTSEYRARASKKTSEAHLNGLFDGVSQGNGSYIFSVKANKEIWVRSSWERRFIIAADKHPQITSIEYEPFYIPYIFDGIEYNYIPDFKIIYDDVIDSLWEIKRDDLLENDLKTQAKIAALNKFSDVHNMNSYVLTLKHIEEMEKEVEKLEIPKKCPACCSNLEIKGEYLYCTNHSCCPAQVKGRIINWITNLDILEWGDKLIDQLLLNKKIEKISDIYKLTEKDLSSLERMGQKSAKRCLDSLELKKTITLQKFFGSLGIPNCGDSTLDLIIKGGFNSFEKIMGVTDKNISGIKGLGDMRVKSFISFISDNRDEINEINKNLKILSTSTSLAGINFCFTGSFKTAKREVLEDLVKSHSGGVKDNVTKDTNFLVTNDTNSGSSKNTKAKQLGITILTEEGFLALVESKS